ncbi:MAG: DNA sulfur modification protein DndB [Gammaproteobacteria bacterium]|nr:DNA sulfur modification protein DndB [Gammaproteobacteria bacterium]MCW8839757.1 DNA sulfur modification protein DndB [Gammaproteobacteria bacterium]MCW8959279.1 DNA sulfur modification protein DndB [Gammaproteobacteria bacterium]MCW8992430.1 DNA sulfur modification protein DndB [Gammaproteobacteria bacterium]
MDTNFEYNFPAIRGVQAGREYYVSMCPLKLIPKIFIFDEEELVPELRAQRILNRTRVPEIANYIVDNKNNYVFSAITASINGDVRFSPMGEEGDISRIGSLHIDMQSQFIINDGQHRRAAIEAALKQEPRLGDETISVVFFVDRGLERCQQMFADLNRYAIRPSKSLGLLYDHRDDKAQLAKLVVFNSKVFNGLVEMEKSTLSTRSRKLFTLSAIYQANTALLGDNVYENIEEASAVCVEYWDEVAMQLPEWGFVRDSKMTAGDVRQDFVHSHAILLQALGYVGRQLIQMPKTTWKKQIKKLKTINWSRKNAKTWEGRAMIGGRVSKASHNITLTTNLIKQKVGLELNPEEKKAERAFKRGEYG